MSSSYKAIISGYNWNSEPTLTPQRTPIFLTYSFANSSWGWGGGLKGFNKADQKLARYALKQWEDACGIRFLETKSADADINLGWRHNYNNSTIGWADFPEFETPEGYKPGEVLAPVWGEVNIRLNTTWRDELSKNKSYKIFVLLHEIGHALGLKHPHHKMPYNKKLLKKSLDSTKNTVMSYNNGDSEIYPTKLGKLDKKAIKELYGPSSADGKHLSGWSWNKHTETLTQIGKAGSDRIHGTGVLDIIQGLDGNDQLFGFDGDDILHGGAGKDTLVGGHGDDIFIFDTPLDSGTNVDKIAGFDEGDKIYLSSSAFPVLPKGELAPKHFSNHRGSAHDADDWIILDDALGLLFYDPDGSGAAQKIAFAEITELWLDGWLSGPKNLTPLNIYII